MQPHGTLWQQSGQGRCSQGGIAVDTDLLPNSASWLIAAGSHAAQQAGQLATQAGCGAQSPGHSCQKGAFARIGQANNAHISHNLHSSKDRPEHLSATLPHQAHPYLGFMWQNRGSASPQAC